MFIENGNVKKLQHVCKPVMPMVFFRQASIYELFTTGISNGFLKENGERILLEQIFRLRKEFPNKKRCCFSVYSDARLLEKSKSHLIVRYTEWNIVKNKYLIFSKGEEKKEALKASPDIDSITILLKGKLKYNLLKKLNKIAIACDDGIELKAANKRKKYSEIELVMLYDWGELRGSWGNSKQLRNAEGILDEIEGDLCKCLEKRDTEVYDVEVDFDYIVPVNLIQKIVCEGM